MIKTEAGEKMKEENPVDKIDTIDGQELLRQELEKQGKKFGMPEMNMGGLMSDGMGVIIGIEAESGNHIPAGSKPEEVADDIPAMLSEGEYVVPADVVRWHGVKTFEELRCEAKMGMGLMAQDGRIAEVDDDYEHGHESPEYEIEEKDKPEVEKAEVEVVHAAEGVSLEDPIEPAGGPYYGYRVVYDPEAGRYVYKAVDPISKEPVTADEFDPALSTRYTPEALLGIGAEEEEEEEEEEGPTVCPEGYTLQNGQCVPMTPVDMGGDGPDPSTQYTRSVQNQFGYTRKTLPATAAVVPLLGAVKFAQNVNNATAVSEARKALGLEGLSLGEQLGAGFTGKHNEGIVGDLGIGTAEYTVSLGEGREDGGAAGGGVYDISTGKMLTSREEITAAGRNARTTLTVAEAQRRQQMAAQGATFPGDSLARDSSFSGVSSGTSFAEAARAGGYDSPSYADIEAADAPVDNNSRDSSYGDGGYGYGQPADQGEGSGVGGASDEDDTGDTGGGGFESSSSAGYDYAKGGYVTKKNKPKVATMQYSKGSK